MHTSWRALTQKENNIVKKFLIIPIITICIILISCSRDNNADSNKEYFIIDSTETNRKDWERQWKEYASFPILFLGNLEDTIYLNHKLSEYPVPPPPISHQIYGFEFLEDSTILLDMNFNTMKYKKNMAIYEQNLMIHPLKKFCSDYFEGSSIYVSDSLDIKVDINFNIAKIDNKGGHYNGFPIIITNHLSDTIFIDSKPKITAYFEAKDSLGIWRKIIDCDYHGMPIAKKYLLPPGYSIISSIYKTNGNYETIQRIKIGNNYSNEWIGKINYNQFYWDSVDRKTTTR